MNVQTQLARGIEAAKDGKRVVARELLYAVLDTEPKNETAWIWLSYVVDTVEDRQICLENVLVINPGNDYALKGLAKLRSLTTSPVLQPDGTKVGPSKRKKPLVPNLVIAFWMGIGLFFGLFGFLDLLSWGRELVRSRTFPSYITSYQLATLAISIIFLIFGITALNIAWAVYKRQKIGYFTSIIFSLGLALVGPTALLIKNPPDYLLAAVAAVLPAVVLFITLARQTGLTHDR